MPYNYATAFYDHEAIKEASLVALLNYRNEFPDAGYINLDVFLAERQIELRSSNGPLRVYSFEELGFSILPDA